MAMIAIIDYGMGNLGSIAKALEHVGGEVRVTGDPSVLAEAERIVLPGVGAFGDGMKNLRACGMADALQKEVAENGKPFWGICLGMQLMAKKGYEFGEHEGFAWVEGEVRRFDVSKHPGLKIPHIGWNDVHFVREHPMLRGFKNPTDFYFVHSYHVVTDDAAAVLGICNHGYDFPACMARSNLFATQFHPEKSQKDGLTMLRNFLTWQP